MKNIMYIYIGHTTGSLFIIPEVVNTQCPCRAVPSSSIINHHRYFPVCIICSPVEKAKRELGNCSYQSVLDVYYMFNLFRCGRCVEDLCQVVTWLHFQDIYYHPLGSVSIKNKTNVHSTSRTLTLRLHFVVTCTILHVCTCIYIVIQEQHI